MRNVKEKSSSDVGPEAAPLFHNQDDMKEEDDLWKWLLDLSRVPSEVRPPGSEWGVFEKTVGFQDKIWCKKRGFLREQHGGKKSKSGGEGGKFIFKTRMVKRWSMSFSQGRLTRKPGS